MIKKVKSLDGVSLSPGNHMVEIKNWLPKVFCGVGTYVHAHTSNKTDPESKQSCWSHHCLEPCVPANVRSQITPLSIHKSGWPCSPPARSVSLLIGNPAAASHVQQQNPRPPFSAVFNLLVLYCSSWAPPASFVSQGFSPLLFQYATHLAYGHSLFLGKWPPPSQIFLSLYLSKSFWYG